MTRETIWYQNGKDLGYPDCCIEYFIGRGKLILQGRQCPLDQNQENIIMYSNGFIPCHSCAAKIADGLPLESLIKDGSEEFPPFPEA